MISTSWSTSSKRVAIYRTAGKLAEFCLQLFPLIVVHSDDYGRQDADPSTIKLRLDPGSPRPEKEWIQALVHLHTVGLITLYEADGKCCLQVTDFDEHQPGLLSKRTDSRIPTLSTVTELPGIYREFRSNLTKPNLTEQNLTQPIGTALTRVVGASVRLHSDSPIRARFERFWSHYPKKVGKDAAWREWQALAPGDDLTDRILAALQWQRASAQWLKDGGQFIPHPRTYLHQQRWLDEPVHVPILNERTIQSEQAVNQAVAFMNRKPS